MDYLDAICKIVPEFGHDFYRTLNLFLKFLKYVNQEYFLH